MYYDHSIIQDVPKLYATAHNKTNTKRLIHCKHQIAQLLKFRYISVFFGEKCCNEAPPVRGSKWFAHLLICGGGGGLMEFDAEFKFAKIQNSHVEGGWGLAEFDAEFKFAKIQNSHVGGGGGGSQNLMLGSDLLKSKILMFVGLAEFDAECKFAKIQNSHVDGGGWGEGGGGGSWNLMLSANLLKKKKKFSGKNWNGFVLDFEYQVVPLYEV